LADRYAESDDYDGAVKLAARAEELGRATGNPPLLAVAKERGKELGDLKRTADGLKKYFKTLEADAGDPAANEAVGIFLCLARGDWKRGLPMLAKGSDTALRKLAELELADPTDAPSQAELGNGWAAQADKNPAIYKARARGRAAEWLRRAIPKLTGTEKVKAEKLLASLVPILDLGNGVTMELVYVKSGVFTMGSSIGKAHNFQIDERPEHKVTITTGFYIGKYEVTRQQFTAFVNSTGYKTDAERGGKTWANSEAIAGLSWKNPGFKQEDDHPVACVSWNDAKSFCDWASKRARRTVTLPAEAEWEFACRAGTTTKWYFGDTRKDSAQYGWTDPVTHPVGNKKPNAWGLYDMYGSVWEWCQDFAGGYPAGDVVDPTGPAQGGSRILRGGGTLDYRHGPFDGRSAWRLTSGASSSNTIFGFRVVVR
jgi:formylglycine-generating enzyme required for sulfatase activity